MIKELLNSSNLEDIVLGLRMMENLDLFIRVKSLDGHLLYNSYYQRKKTGIKGNYYVALSDKVFHIQDDWISLCKDENAENIVIQYNNCLYNERKNT